MKKILILMAVALGFTSTSCARTAPKAEAAEATQVETTTGVPSTVKIVPTSITGGQAIIDAIKANYPNKVVLIDIWATWCPPCRAALKDIDAIKPTYQNKGVVFVYLTGETSPQDKWQAMIPSISGDHYRLTKQQWQNLCTDLNIPGIPAYVLLNKDGSVGFSNLTEGGYPGNEVIQNNLEVAISK